MDEVAQREQRHPSASNWVGSSAYRSHPFQERVMKNRDFDGIPPDVFDETFDGIPPDVKERTVKVFKIMEQKYALLEAVCIQHGLSLKEYQFLSCCLDGKMTDGEIRAIMGIGPEQFDELAEVLRRKDLIGRRKGMLIASIEGRSAYYDVPPIAA